MDINKENTEKMKKLFKLSDRLESHLLNYDEFNEMVTILNFFGIDKNNLEEKLKHYGFDNSNEFVSTNFNYLDQKQDSKLNVSRVIGYLTGITQSTQMKYIKSYEDFKKDQENQKQ